MDISNMRNMVVLKNLPSNIVDEAIVILKTNKKIKRPEMAENIVNNSKTYSNLKENSNDYIINEAEMLISDYISKLEKPKKINDNTEIIIKYTKLKKLTFILGIMFLGTLLFCIKLVL